MYKLYFYKNLCFGEGMQSFALDYDIQNFPPNYRPLVKHLQSEHNCFIENHGYNFYKCPKCIRLYVKIDFKISYEGKEMKPEYYCSKCKKELKIINNLEDLFFTYPKCSQHKLRLEECGNWD